MIPFGTLSVMLKRAADRAVMDVVGPNGYLMSQEEANKLQKHMNKTKGYTSILDGSDPTTKNYNPAPPPPAPAPWSPGEQVNLVDPATGPAYKPMSDQTYKVESQRYADRRLGNTEKGREYKPAPQWNQPPAPWTPGTPQSLYSSGNKPAGQINTPTPRPAMTNEEYAASTKRKTDLLLHGDTTYWNPSLATAAAPRPAPVVIKGGEPQVMSTGETVTVNPAADGTLDRTVTQPNRRGGLMTGTLHNATPGSFGSNNPNTINMLSKDNIAKFDAIKATGDAGRAAGRFDPHGLTNSKSFPSVAVPYGTYPGGGKNVFQGSVSRG